MIYIIRFESDTTHLIEGPEVPDLEEMIKEWVESKIGKEPFFSDLERYVKEKVQKSEWITNYREWLDWDKKLGQLVFDDFLVQNGFKKLDYMEVTTKYFQKN